MRTRDLWREPTLRKRNLIRSLTLGLVTTLAAGFFLFTSGLRDFELLLHGLLMGVPSAAVVLLVQNVLFPRLLRLTFLPSLILRTLLLGIAVVVGIALGLWLFAMAYSHRGPLHPVVLEYVSLSLLRPEVRIPGAFVFLALLIYAAVEQLTRRLGPGALGDLILGRYHRPRAERRIFLFVDMKDSTRLAEELGPRNYSALVRDFFSDLTLAILESEASVVQFVGDEVVLTWTWKKGIRRANCVRAFLIAKRTLAEQAERYEARYGVVPDFKAGLHGGEVVSTQVGDLRTDLVFHGDTINTTARIRSLCSEVGRDLLVSEELAQELPQFEWCSLGSYRMRGKAQEVKVCTPETSSLSA